VDYFLFHMNIFSFKVAQQPAGRGDLTPLRQAAFMGRPLIAYL
jgi:hypothetical protein